jgi:hypothetical protein
VPLAASKADPALDAFELKPDSLESAPLGHVVDVRPRLDPVCCGSGEQVVDEEAVRDGAYATAAVFGKQPDPNFQVAERKKPPGDPPRARTAGGTHGEERSAIAADETVVLPSALQRSSIVDAEAKPLVLAGSRWVPSEPQKRSEIVFIDRSQKDTVSLHELSLAHTPGRQADSVPSRRLVLRLE